jgi:VWFA-related protein
MGLCILASRSPAQQITQPPGQPAGQQSSAPAPQAVNRDESEISTHDLGAPLRVRVNLVVVRAVVRDPGGKEVGNLKREDFQVFDNGKEQKISAFSVETAGSQRAVIAETAAETKAEAELTAAKPDTGAQATPGPVVLPQRFVALVFDDLHMKTADALAVRAAAERLFAGLGPTDRVAIYSTSGEVQQGFTGDTATLRATVAAMMPRRGMGEGEYQCPNITYYMADLIINKHDDVALGVLSADAATNCPMNANQIKLNAQNVLFMGDQNTRLGSQALERVLQLLASAPGQRVLVYVSPGFIVGDDIQWTTGEVIEPAVRAGVVVNTIDARGLYTPDNLPDIDAPPSQSITKETGIDFQGLEGTYRMQAQFQSGVVLGEIADATGGTYFHNRNDLDQGMTQALAGPGVTYVLGFYPQNLKLDGKFHKLKVAVTNGQKYQVQARNGYYAPKQLADPEEMAKQEVRAVVFSQDEIVNLPVVLKTQFFKPDAESAQLSALTRLDVSGIRFRKVEGRSCNYVVLATAVFDDNGNFIDGQMREIDLKLKDASLERYRANGITIKIDFKLKPGTYLVRSVVRDSEEEQITARNAVAVIPK